MSSTNESTGDDGSPGGRTLYPGAEHEDEPAEGTVAVGLRPESFETDESVRSTHRIWRLFVEIDHEAVPQEAFVASFPSREAAVEALHRAADHVERLDVGSPPLVDPADVAADLSVRGPTA
jgi:hypothetical protein